MKTWSTSGGHKVIKVLGGRSNVFLLTNGQTHLLVDTGPGFMWKILQKRLDKLGIEKIDLLVLTHAHFDHAANAARIREKYHARVLIHRAEAEYLANGDNVLPAGTNAVTKFLVRALGKPFRSFARYRPCSADETFDDTCDLSGYGFSAYLLHTPGHTPGSASVIIGEEIALVGDTMFGVFPRTIFPPFATDPSQMLKSWEKLLQTGCKGFLPSHGSARTRSLAEKDFRRRSR